MVICTKKRAREHTHPDTDVQLLVVVWCSDHAGPRMHHKCEVSDRCCVRIGVPDNASSKHVGVANSFDLVSGLCIRF